MANSQDDFLSFKEYPMTHDEQSGNAQINVNSPTRSQTFTSSTGRIMFQLEDNDLSID